MKDGATPAFKASESGHTETLALLLENKADINAADEVQQLIIFEYLLLIDNELYQILKLLSHIINDFST
jgi:ankyrin repeat protein